MTDPKVSVIIPIYCAEKYIGRCVDSLLSGSYQNLEIILIDDGSTDSSLHLCHTFAEKDSRIRVFHQENAGVSAARNKGLSLASGEYISFIDADDYVKEDYFQTLVGLALKENADLVCCDFEQIADFPNAHFYAQRVKTSRKIDDMHALFSDSAKQEEGYPACIWAKLYRAELAKKVSFRPLKFGEDHIYIFEIFSLNPSTYLTTYKGYCYFLNDSSVTAKSGTVNFGRCKDEVAMQEFKISHLPDSCSDLYPKFYEHYSVSVLTMVRAMILNKKGKSEKKDVRERAKEILKHSDLLSPSTRKKLCLYTASPFLYGALIHLKEIITNTRTFLGRKK